MATFSTRFLGCKVSFADAQAIRERLRADGHEEVADGGEIQVVNTCCVTHEAVSKSRQAAARAARSARSVYVTGCASNLEGAFGDAAPNVVVTGRTGAEAAAFVAGDVGAIGCVNAEHRLDRVRAFVKIQDGCSFSCAFCVIPLVRGATRSRTAEAVLGEIRRRVGAGASRDRPDRREPRLLPRPRPPATRLPASSARPARSPASSGFDSRRSRSTTSTTRWSERSWRRRPSRRTSTFRCSPATTASCARWVAATPRRSSSGGWRRSRAST